MTNEVKAKLLKPGDIVIANHSSSCGSYTKGKKYIVKTIHKEWLSIKTTIDDKESTENGWSLENFDLLDSFNKDILKVLFGDIN